MNRSEKIKLVERMNERFAGAANVVLTSFSGLTASQATDLRAKIREVGGQYLVVKNRLAKRAAAGTPMAPLADRLTGPCAVASHADDAVTLAKTLAAFHKENPALELLAGIIDSREVVDAAGVKQLAALPALPEQRARLLALLHTPAGNLVRLLQAPALQVARVIDARAGQHGGGCRE